LKDFLRLVRFSYPLGFDISRYLVLAVLAVVFGLVNFTLFIPLLNLLFQTLPESETLIEPEFAFNTEFAVNFFQYHFKTIILNHGKNEALKFICLILFVSVLLANLFKFLSQRVLTTVRTRMVKNLRQDLFNRLTELDLRFYYLNRKGELLSTLSNDVHEVENSVVSSIQVVIREPLMIIGFFYLLFKISVSLTLFTIVLLPLSFLIIAEVTRRLKADAQRGQQLLGSLMSIMEETISGIRIIRAFNAQKLVKDKFEKENNRFRALNKSVVNKRELASPLSEFMGVSILTVIFYYGGNLVFNQEANLSASEFITYIILYSQILIPVKNITTAITNVQKGMVSGKRLFAILDSPVTVNELANAKPFPQFNESIEFRNVSFSHGEKEILFDVNLTIEKGKTVALVGASGAGKSTLSDLIPRFYDVTMGEILMDGIPLHELKLSELRNQLGIVSQESILFNDTIANNIKLGKPEATIEEVEQAARIANAHEFIFKNEEGYQHQIGDRGSKLSGGQKQRLSIARAVLKNPPILILDEATSSLDTESERLVQEALQNLMKNRTTLVIAHRLSTVRNADKIVVLDAGRIVEQGTHDELIQSNGYYRKLVEMQGFE
jgi:ATP-binding cassette, subfamily B, bacterial MsbA